MPLKTQQHEQFKVLMAGDIDINPTSLKNQGRHIFTANQAKDILTLIEATQFDLIILDLTVKGSVASVPDRLQQFGRPGQSELVTRIKDPHGINNQIPLIAVINPTEDSQREPQYPMEFDDWLVKPVKEEQLDKVIALWQNKTSASDYIEILLDKTKNNCRLALTIFEKLFEELPLQISGIKDALEKEHYDLAQETSHKLNGSASFCGLLDIQQAANALEGGLLNNDYANANQAFLRLRQSALNLTRQQKTILAKLQQMLTP